MKLEQGRYSYQRPAKAPLNELLLPAGIRQMAETKEPYRQKSEDQLHNRVTKVNFADDVPQSVIDVSKELYRHQVISFRPPHAKGGASKKQNDLQF